MLLAALVVTVGTLTAKLNVAVALLSAFMVTVQVVAVPLHAPLQPANTLPVAGAAVNVTAVSLAKFSVQSVPQLMPAGVLTTVPVPFPNLLKEKEKSHWPLRTTRTA